MATKRKAQYSLRIYAQTCEDILDLNDMTKDDIIDAASLTLCMNLCDASEKAAAM